MESKREPSSLHERSQFYRRKLEQQLHGNRCNENQINSWSGKIEMRHSRNSSNRGVLKERIHHVHEQKASKSDEGHHGIPQQTLSPNTGTIRTKNEYKKQRNDEWCIVNECDNVIGSFSSENKDDMIDHAWNAGELSRPDDHGYRTRRNGGCCMGNGELNRTNISTDAKTNSHHGCTFQLCSDDHFETYHNYGENNWGNDEWCKKYDLENIARERSPTTPSDVSHKEKIGKEKSVEQSTKNTAPHSIQQVAGILVSREKPLYQNASRQIKSLPSRQLPQQQARQTKPFPLQFVDKDRQRNETSFRSSMPKRSAPRQSRKAFIQQVSEQPVREENCLFSIPTGSSQPRWLANQHISGQLTRKSIAAATEELTGLPVIKMRWNPIQQHTVRQPKIHRSSRLRETEGEVVPTNQISREPMTESGLVATGQFSGLPARKKMWIPIQYESLDQTQIQRPLGSPARETSRWAATQQTSRQLERQMRRLHIQQSSVQPARDTRSPSFYQSSEKRVRETRLAPNQETQRQPRWVPTPPIRGKRRIKTGSPPTEQVLRALHSYTKLPPIQQTFDVSRSETIASATQETGRPCRELTKNEQSPESTLTRNGRRPGKQEAYLTGDYCRRRRQGVCTQTDETEAQRTFVRVLDKRF